MRRGKKPTSDAEPDLAGVLEQVSRDRGLDQSVLVSAIEEALQAAAIRYYGDGEKLQARFDRNRGLFEVYSRKRVVETVQDAHSEIALEKARERDPLVAPGAFVEILKDTDAIGRIAAQTAKQVIATRMRDVETESIHNEFKGRVGEVVTGLLKRYEGPDMILEVGRAEAVLPKKEQSPIEHYEPGDRVKVVILKVQRGGFGVKVIVSRADTGLLQKLLEAEVPEIRDRVVIVRGMVREAGERSKICVSSKEKGIDPVGACVGVKGTRIQAIIRELRGERIDVIEWSQDPALFLSNALSPARVRRVALRSLADKVAEVVVDEKQLSLAIGKRGQNVRLASRLTGWHIDIKSGDQRGDVLAEVFPSSEQEPLTEGEAAQKDPSAARVGEEVDKRDQKEEKSSFAEARDR